MHRKAFHHLVTRKTLAIVLVAITTILFIWQFTNRYLNQSKAASGSINVTMSPATDTLSVGQQKKLTVLVSATNQGTISGIDLTLLAIGNAGIVSIADPQPFPAVATNPFQKIVNQGGHIVYVAAVPGSQLPSQVSFDVTVNGIGGALINPSIIKINPNNAQVVGPGNNPFALGTLQQSEYTVSNGSVCTPQPTCKPGETTVYGDCPAPPVGQPSTCCPSIACLGPTPTCTPRPACLDATPACKIAQPINGWCQVTPTPTGKVCPTPPICRLNARSITTGKDANGCTIYSCGVTPTPTIPPNCRYHQVQCFQAPCPSPTLICDGTPTPTSIPPACSTKVNGDANCDQKINFYDFEIWRREFFTQNGQKLADFNLDNKVDMLDFQIWVDHRGQ